MLRAIVLAAVLAARLARADELTGTDGGGTSGLDHPAIENRVNVRFGMSSADTDKRPSICVDVRVIGRFGVETCGTGQAIIHNDPGQEMMHVRANYTIAGRSLWIGTLHVRGGVGFAELQVGPDDPGFSFNHAAANGNSTAGTEAVLSAQWLLPLHAQIDFVITATAGLAYFAGAPDLASTKSVMQGFTSVEAGIGW